MAASRFVEVSDKEISEIKINSVLKNTKGLCKNTKTIVLLRLSDYPGIFTSYKHTPILYSTNFWHSSKVQIENCNHDTVRGNKATALQLYSSTTLQPDSSTTLQLYNTTAQSTALRTTLQPCAFTTPPLQRYNSRALQLYSPTTLQPYNSTTLQLDLEFYNSTALNLKFRP